MATTAKDTDRIEKKVILKAPRARVWRAISDSTEFGAWFGAAIDGPFVPGKRAVGTVVPTKADPDIGKSQEAYAGAKFELTVDRIEPESLFSFRWHPFAVDPTVDYSGETPTLVVFTLQDAPDGTLLTITESGFDAVPAARRAKAFQMNDQGWGAQLLLVEKYLALVA